MWTGAHCISELGTNSLHSARSVRCWWVENETLNLQPAQPPQPHACFQADGCCTGGPVLLQKPGKARVELQPAKAEPALPEPALPGCLSWLHFPWTLTHCCTVAPRYRISSKYFGREGSFPLGHIYMCHGISGQIASCLCQFPASAYKTVFKNPKFSHFAFEFNFIHLSFCTLYWLLWIEAEKMHHVRW